MEKTDFLMLVYSYSNDRNNITKEQILSYATLNPQWLLFPTSDKSIWDICANLLVELPYNIIKTNLVNILECYQDLNWPGVSTITNYLLTIPRADLIEAISNEFQIAKDDECWLFGLVSLIVKADILDTFYSVDKYRQLIIKSSYF